MLDLEAVHARPDLVAGLDFGVRCGQRVEECAVTRAEVADADGALGVGGDFEMLAREELVRDADVTFASDHQSGRRHLELLAGKRSFDADQYDASGVCGRGRALAADRKSTRLNSSHTVNSY